MVPRPGTAAATARPAYGVPSVGSDLRRAIWPAYFIVLVITVMATVGVIISLVTLRQEADWLIMILFGLVIVLTALALFPIGRGLAKGLAPRRASSPGSKAVRTIGVVVLLLLIAPFAFAAVFFTVCSATIAAFSIR